MGIAIISTSKGVMTDKKAKRRKSRWRSNLLCLLIFNQRKMSRIGKAIITIPSGVTITEKDGVVTVKGHLKENLHRSLQKELL